jgi:esterase/lipase
MWSLRTSQCRAAPHLARITLPALVVHARADAGVYESDARTIFDALASSDRELHLLSGDHYFTEPAGARDAVADLIADWVAARGG